MREKGERPKPYTLNPTLHAYTLNLTLNFRPYCVRGEREDQDIERSARSGGDEKTRVRDKSDRGDNARGEAI